MKENKMKKIKKLLLLAIAGAIFFTLAGCSSKQRPGGVAPEALL